MTGSRVLHYEIGEKLGAGGMGTVYRGTDTRLGRPVALKFLSPGQSSDAEQRARLLREARAASALSSSNIASIYDIGEADGNVFLVMELVDGESLLARLSGGPLPIRDAVDIAMQVADALDEAHARGVIHRDVKSANVMITPRGRVKILDFGLAKLSKTAGVDAAETRSGALETVAGTVLGTFSYMSPEQALGRTVDHRTDLFSLGIVLYEMLTGRLPFEGATVTEILDRLVNHEPPALARFNYSVPQPLETIVLKALAKDAAFRYQSAREMYIDLHAVLRTIDSGDRQAARPAAVSGVHGQAAGGSTVGQLPKRAKFEKAVAVMTFSNITREPDDEWIGSGIAETVTTDLKSVKGLTVIGRAQIFDALKQLDSAELQQFDDRLAIQLGRQLGASYIVGGGYQRRGDALRITAQFVNVQTGELKRTVKVDGRIDKIFELQDQIVYELMQGLNVKIDPAVASEIARDETTSVEAYEAYSRGMMNLRMATRDSLDRAVTQFERAIALDANYAEAWAGLGATQHLKGMMLSMPDLGFKGVEALRRAVELDPNAAVSHYLLGNAYTNLGHDEEAIAAIRRSIELDPNNAGAHAALARAFWFGEGRFDEGITELEHSAALNGDGGYTFLQLALLYTLRGHFKRAESAARRAIELQEQYVSGTEGLQIVGAHLRLGYVFYRQGRYDDAIKEYERELAFLGTSDHALRERTTIELNQKLSAAYLRKGETDAANRYFERVIHAFKDRLARGAEDAATKYYVASLYALHGDVEHAVRYFAETLTQQKRLNLARVKLDPDFDLIRQAPEFRQLVGE